jgi:hypothetical protein
MRISTIPVLAVCLGATLAVACGGNKAGAPPASGVSVTGIDVGRSLAADKAIGDVTDSFRPADTIYASVKTDGAGTATLKASWTYGEGQKVDESSQTIAPTGTARTEFHVSKPDGWPPGRYRLDVTLNGNPAGTKQFDVK